MNNTTHEAFLELEINQKQHHVDFAKPFIPTQDPPDQLFEKYSRKTTGRKKYQMSAATQPADNSTARLGSIQSGLAPYNGAWTTWEIAHLLRRTHYGVKKSDVDMLQSKSVSQAVDYLLSPSTPTLPSATPLNYYQDTMPDTAGVALGQNWTQAPLNGLNPKDANVNNSRLVSLYYWSWGLCIDGNAGLTEKMTNFWYHFIPINLNNLNTMGSNGAIMGHDYMKLLRSNALGNYKTLIKAIAKSPAMLAFLSVQSSTATAPNENFARELLELFTMGKQPTQNYTEDDVKSAAKVFSGWKCTSYTTYPFPVEFNYYYHNQTNKQFSSNFANTVIANQAGANGANEFDTFFNMLFTNQATTIARYICRRLYRFFVYYDIDENIENNVIIPLANQFATNWEILPVLKTLFTSEHFFDQVNRGPMIKSPVDFIAGTLRTLMVNTVPASGPNKIPAQYQIWKYFHSYSFEKLGQGLGLAPGVAGWTAYYQSPTYHQNWINSSTIQQRAAFLTSLFTGFYPNSSNSTIKIDPIVFVQQFSQETLQNPDLLLNNIIQLLLPNDLDQTYKDSLKKDNLLGGQIDNLYWTTAWNNYTGAPTNSSYQGIVRSRLNSLLSALLQLAEFQLM